MARSTRRSTRQPEIDYSAAPGWMLVAALAVLVAVAVNALTSTAQAAPVNRCAALARQDARSRCIIRSVFHPHGSAAVRVAWCESRLDPQARNGQFRGVFQMGSSERARFGHGRTVLAQARAARRYYDLAGWGPWACKP